MNDITRTEQQSVVMNDMAHSLNTTMNDNEQYFLCTNAIEQD